MSKLNTVKAFMMFFFQKINDACLQRPKLSIFFLKSTDLNQFQFKLWMRRDQHKVKSSLLLTQTVSHKC